MLTWYSVSAGVLSPLQEHITERLIAYANDGLAVYDQYNANALFIFDLSQPTPPMRIAVDSTLHPALRFVVAGDATAKLNGLFKTLEKGIVPDDVHFNGANYEAELVRDALVRLIGNLTQPPPTRRNPRRKINVNLEVANGFFKMLEQTDVGLNFGQNGQGYMGRGRYQRHRISQRGSLFPGGRGQDRFVDRQQARKRSALGGGHRAPPEPG